MKLLFRKYQEIVVLLFYLAACSASAEGLAQTDKPFDLLKDDITLALPSLNSLIDSAIVHDPQIRFNQLQVKVNKGNLRTQQALWTQDLGLQANVGYGTFNYIYNNSTGAGVPGSYSQTQSQTQYNVGAFFRLPVYDVVNHRNQVKVMKDQVDQAQSLIENEENLVRENVIKQYYTIVSMQRQLQIKSKYLETSKINMQLAEKSFTSGTITVDEYSRVSEIESRTETEYETIKVDFVSAYKTLEVMVGMKFDLNNDNK